MKKLKFLAAVIALSIPLVGAFAFSGSSSTMVNSGGWQDHCDNSDATQTDCYVNGSSTQCKIAVNNKLAFETGSACLNTLNIAP